MVYEWHVSKGITAKCQRLRKYERKDVWLLLSFGLGKKLLKLKMWLLIVSYFSIITQAHIILSPSKYITFSPFCMISNLTLNLFCRFHLHIIILLQISRNIHPHHRRSTLALFGWVFHFQFHHFPIWLWVSCADSSFTSSFFSNLCNL